MRIPTHGPPTHPGEMLLEEFLKPLGISQVELAKCIGVSYPRVNELIHGKRDDARHRFMFGAPLRHGSAVLVESTSSLGSLSGDTLPRS